MIDDIIYITITMLCEAYVKTLYTVNLQLYIDDIIYHLTWSDSCNAITHVRYFLNATVQDILVLLCLLLWVTISVQPITWRSFLIVCMIHQPFSHPSLLVNWLWRCQLSFSIMLRVHRKHGSSMFLTQVHLPCPGEWLEPTQSHRVPFLSQTV